MLLTFQGGAVWNSLPAITLWSQLCGIFESLFCSLTGWYRFDSSKKYLSFAIICNCLM